MTSIIKIQNSWVFNSKFDLLSFIAPFVVAVIFIGTKYDDVNKYLVSYFLARIFIGGGHIFATYIPFMVAKKLKERLENRVFLVPVVFVGFYAAANFISDTFFKNLLAITGLLHIYFQHYAWLKLAQINLTPQRKRLEKIFFLILIIFPNSIWFLGQLQNSPSYLYGITITRHIPNFNLFDENILLSFTIFAGISSVMLAFRKENSKIVIDLGKLLFLLSTTVWMCFGLFFVKSLGFFHVYLAISHGLSYICYISQGWPKHLDNGFWDSNYRFLKVSIFSIILGTIWSYSFRATINILPKYLIFIPWIPLLIHYGFDSTIWRKPRLAPIKE